MVIWLIPVAFFAIGTFGLHDALQWSDADWDRASLGKLRWFSIVALL